MEGNGDFANLSNLAYIEHLYYQYLQEPQRVDKSWQHFFEGMALGEALHKAPTKQENSPDIRIARLIEAYRTFGYKGAHFNPIFKASTQFEQIEELNLKSLGFNEKELKQFFPTDQFLQEKFAPLHVLIQSLQQTYCGSVGVEYMATHSKDMQKFIQDKIEPHFAVLLGKQEKIDTFYALSRSELMEAFIQRKYPGQKRFSLEGAETLIPIMMSIIQEGAIHGIEEIILGMAHRGRLNVLANVLGKSYSAIFDEFENACIPDSFKGSGDVKYHKGYSVNLPTKEGGHIHVFLSSNPSHLEAVAPIVEGYARGKQVLKKGSRTDTIIPCLIHGETAIAGQGVVYETLQLSQLQGYQTGGTIHIIINNQIGFTASQEEGRSMRYSSDIGKTFGIPIFHINGDDPEKGIEVAKLAVQIRQRFGCDVFIEMHCYRKYGHNEAYEPMFTNPTLYQWIRQQEGVQKMYRNKLIAEGILSEERGDQIEQEVKDSLEEAFQQTQQRLKDNFSRKKISKEMPIPLATIETAVPIEILISLTQKFTKVPQGFHLHRKLKRLLDARLTMITADPNSAVIDWGMAEYLAYSTLLTQGVHVRLSGQDSRRGTFSHRHVVLCDQQTGEYYFPLCHLREDQAFFAVYNSPLSEYAVMGFEYGYSLAYQNGLIMWEGQFGDFANGDQVIIDQYITSAQEKWGYHCPITLLLPHGYEGQGPEHSSARIERFLQLAGKENLLVINPSTPAQLFHALRYQGLTQIKKPLIIFTPKALLRYTPSLSPPIRFATGTFQTVIDPLLPCQNIKRLIFCSGKIYYDLIRYRQDDSIAIIRLEQLYPIDQKKVAEIFKKYHLVSECLWVQEEHKNMGPYCYIRPIFEKILPQKLSLRYVGRNVSATPATGLNTLHQQELAQVLKEAFE